MWDDISRQTLSLWAILPPSQCHSSSVIEKSLGIHRHIIIEEKKWLAFFASQCTPLMIFFNAQVACCRSSFTEDTSRSSIYQSTEMDGKVILVLLLIASMCAGRKITDFEDEMMRMSIDQRIYPEGIDQPIYPEGIDKRMYADDEGNAQKCPKRNWISLESTFYLCLFYFQAIHSRFEFVIFSSVHHFECFFCNSTVFSVYRVCQSGIHAHYAGNSGVPAWRKKGSIFICIWKMCLDYSNS